MFTQVIGSKDNWRKLEFLRSFTPEEMIVQGDYSCGSVWNFEYAGGAFEVQFMFDSYNHFNCPKFPAHSHWIIVEGKHIEINWGKFGKYDLVVDATSGTMVGCKKGEPDNWRKATFIRPLSPSDLENPGSTHEHAHDHH